MLVVVLTTSVGCSLVIGQPGDTAVETPVQPIPNETVAQTPLSSTAIAVPTTPAVTEILSTPVLTPEMDVTVSPISGLPTFWPTSTPAITPTPAPIVYIVQPGDTIGSIAKRLGLSDPYAIAEYNNLVDPNVIEIGQALLIPQNLIGDVPTGAASGAIPAAVVNATATYANIPSVKPTSTATATPVMTQTANLSGRIINVAGCPTTNLAIQTGDNQYIYLIFNGATLPKEGSPTDYLATVIGVLGSVCDRPAIWASSITWYLPTPTSTSAATSSSSVATATPAPTSTPLPTNTPYPTTTPYPTPTPTGSTPYPTNTPYPTYTPYPQPTYTPAPTYTPYPTSTPPVPWTPIVANTPTATSTGVPGPTATFTATPFK